MINMIIFLRFNHSNPQIMEIMVQTIAAGIGAYTGHVANAGVV
jgi:hypothetical protein